MKKVLFLQIKGNSLGGIWFVDKALGEELIKRGYDVSVIGIRNNHPGIEIKDTPIKITTINKKDKWEIAHKRDVLNSLKNGKFLSTLKQYCKDDTKLKKDYEMMKKMIRELNPDYIISTHYQTLFGVPKEYLSKVVFVQHSSFNYLLNDKMNIRVLTKLNDQIYGFAWLCKTTMERAIKFGFKKNEYIYNPVKFHTDKKANVIKNKKIAVVLRIHPEKRIDLMIKMVNEVFQDKKFKDWKFEIYGIGSFNKESEHILKESKQICYKGMTEDPLEVLLNSSLTLNTSIFEGFSLSIIESFTCGLPIVAFNFGESAHEQIIDDYNGYVVRQNDEEAFKEKLRMLLENPQKLEELSNNAKEFSEQFEVKKIADKWEDIFRKMN